MRNNVKRRLRSCSLASLLRTRAWLAVAALSVSCISSHERQSTETGNPPLLDPNRVALVVTSDSVRIEGRAGAVSPGGITVEAVVVGTGAVVRSKSSSDGSFDIPLSADPNGVVELRAVSNEHSSGSVYVTQGGAAVGTGEDASLSCTQRTYLAAQAVGSAASAADRSCSRAADCRFVPIKTSCTASCGDLPISRGAVEGVRSALHEVERGLCAGFVEDGCSLPPEACPAPLEGSLACVAGRCTRSPVGADACPACLQDDIQWGFDRDIYSLTACDFLVHAEQDGRSCTGRVPQCGASGNPIGDLIAALADPDVEAALANRTWFVNRSSPGPVHSFDGRGGNGFVVEHCDSWPECQGIPRGIANLFAVLDRIAAETTCELACTPGFEYVENYCWTCDESGTGCAQVEAACAPRCTSATASSCASGICGPRGICEPACGD